MKYISLIIVIILLILSGCSRNSNETDSETHVLSNDTINPFLMDSIRYDEFFKQSEISNEILKRDSLYSVITEVKYTYRDSIVVEKIKFRFPDQETIIEDKLKINISLVFRRQSHGNATYFLIESADVNRNNIVIARLKGERFCSILQSLKFMNNRIKNIPSNKAVEFEIYESNCLEIHARYDEEYYDKWSAFLTLRDNQKDGKTMDIDLTKELLNILIIKLDIIKNNANKDGMFNSYYTLDSK